MLVDADSKAFITLRECQALAFVRTEICADELHVHIPNHNVFKLPYFSESDLTAPVVKVLFFQSHFSSLQHFRYRCISFIMILPQIIKHFLILTGQSMEIGMRSYRSRRWHCCRSVCVLSTFCQVLLFWFIYLFYFLCLLCSVQTRQDESII